MLGVGWDEELGGAAFTARVVQLLLRSADRRVARDRRAMARLQQEANKAKEVRPERAPALRVHRACSVGGAMVVVWVVRVVVG